MQLKPECAANVRRALRTRAVRVNLMPDIESSCREALSEYCSTNVKPMQVCIKKKNRFLKIVR